MQQDLGFKFAGRDLGFKPTGWDVGFESLNAKPSGVATISRLLKIIGLVCRISSLL